MARFEDQDLTDAEFRECDLTRARLIGVVMQDAVIDGLVSNLVVNGVEVTSYVEAELDRRHPVRLLIRSADPADLQEASRQLRADWAATLGRPPGMPKGAEQQGLDRAATPSLDDVLAVHDVQGAELGRWLSTVTPDELAAPAPVPPGRGWPPYARGKSVLECVHVVLGEEWAHHGFCVRDLDLLGRLSPSAVSR